jgi:hypothetical protein
MMHPLLCGPSIFPSLLPALGPLLSQGLSRTQAMGMVELMSVRRNNFGMDMMEMAIYRCCVTQPSLLAAWLAWLACVGRLKGLV